MAPRQRLTPTLSSSEEDTTTSASSPRSSRCSSPSSFDDNDTTTTKQHFNNDNGRLARQQQQSQPLLTTTTTMSSSSSSLQQQQLEKQAEMARDRHDLFNLLALVFVVGMTVINWDWYKFLQGKGPQEAWTGDYFIENWAMTVLYFLADLVWVARVPICVKSPDVIIKHHLVAILYLSGPLAWPEFRWFMGACLSVEINTWFLILRRVVYKRRESTPPWVSDFVSTCFYISWIVIRCFVYPAILVSFLQMAYVGILETQSILHLQLLFIPIHFFLCLLNLKWSYDLFKPIVLRWMDLYYYNNNNHNIQRRENPRGAVSSGL